MGSPFIWTCRFLPDSLFALSTSCIQCFYCLQIALYVVPGKFPCWNHSIQSGDFRPALRQLRNWKSLHLDTNLQRLLFCFALIAQRACCNCKVVSISCFWLCLCISPDFVLYFVEQPEVLVWLGIFCYFGMAKISGEMKMFWTNFRKASTLWCGFLFSGALIQWSLSVQMCEVQSWVDFHFLDKLLDPCAQQSLWKNKWWRNSNHHHP